MISSMVRFAVGAFVLSATILSACNLGFDPRNIDDAADTVEQHLEQRVSRAGHYTTAIANPFGVGALVTVRGASIEGFWVVLDGGAWALTEESRPLAQAVRPLAEAESALQVRAGLKYPANPPELPNRFPAD